MKVLSLKIGDKTYTTSRITAYLSRKAMAINTASLTLAKEGVALRDSEEKDLDATSALMGKLTELSDMKSWFVCQVYGERFSLEELEMSLTTEEIEEEVRRITTAIFGVIEKNV
jgi:hypothetical protein